MNPHPPWGWWLLIAATALSLRLYVAPLEPFADEGVYIQHAWNLSRGFLDLSDSSWYVHRIPVYLPVGIVYWIAGVGFWRTLAWPLLAFLAQLLLAMILAQRISGRPASILAGVALAFLPLDVVSSVHLMPDIFMGTLMSASAVFWWFGGEAATPGRKLLLLVFAGVLLALAGLVRPYALILGLFFVADLWISRQPSRNLLLMASGGAVVVLAYLVTYQLAVGNPLVRLEVVTNTYSSGGLAEPAHFLYYPRVLLDPRELLSLHGIAFLLCVPLLLLRPRRAELRLLCWLLLIALFLQFGSMSLKTYLPILKRNRLLTPLSLPLCVLLGIALARAAGVDRSHARIRATLAHPRVAMGLVVASMGLLLVTSVVQLQRRIQTERPRYQAYAAASALILDRAPLMLRVDDWRTAIRLGPHVSFFGGRGFYFGGGDEERMQKGSFDPGGRLAYLDPTIPLAQLPPGLILIDRNLPYARKDLVLESLGLCDDCDPRTRAGLDLLFESAGLELYELTPRAEESQAYR